MPQFAPGQPSMAACIFSKGLACCSFPGKQAQWASSREASGRRGAREAGLRDVGNARLDAVAGLLEESQELALHSLPLHPLLPDLHGDLPVDVLHHGDHGALCVRSQLLLGRQGLLHLPEFGLQRPQYALAELGAAGSMLLQQLCEPPALAFQLAGGVLPLDLSSLLLFPKRVQGLRHAAGGKLVHPGLQLLALLGGLADVQERVGLDEPQLLLPPLVVDLARHAHGLETLQQALPLVRQQPQPGTLGLRHLRDPLVEQTDHLFQFCRQPSPHRRSWAGRAGPGRGAGAGGGLGEALLPTLVQLQRWPATSGRE
mmetsp:Transcript_8530/g.25879  ORF Transcript_8530/g.25879 Transcript_8530/m.25879 type:complete len:314 (-) Transcript_8530:117-1058(-)